MFIKNIDFLIYFLYNFKNNFSIILINLYNLYLLEAIFCSKEKLKFCFWCNFNKNLHNKGIDKMPSLQCSKYQ